MEKEIKVTIISQDGVVMIDGKSEKFDLGLDPDIWAIQWDGSKGEIEFNNGKPSEKFTNYSKIKKLVAGHAKQKLKREAEELKAVDDAVKLNKKLEDALPYDAKRKKLYNQLEQFEMIFDDKVNGTNKWVEAIEAIKKLHPKPKK